MEQWSPSLNGQLFCMHNDRTRDLTEEVTCSHTAACPGFVYHYEGGQGIKEKLLPLGGEIEKSHVCLLLCGKGSMHG